MFCANLLFVLNALLAVSLIQGSLIPQGRMTEGNPVETLRRFPHNVLIQDYYNKYYNSESNFCGGSIINQRWILTAASCINKFEVIQVIFKRLFLNKTNGSYSAVVNRDAVHEYPTQYDNIALLELPFALDFSDTLQPVEIYSGPNIAADQFVVMPGYDNSSLYVQNPTTPAYAADSISDNPMVYGMFSMSSAAACNAALGKIFDEYLQYCTRPWSNTHNSPSILDTGSGLVINWPARPQLVGIYIGSSDWNNIAIFTNVAKYATWIRGVTGSNPA